MGTRGLDAGMLLIFLFLFSYFWDRFRTKCRAGAWTDYGLLFVALRIYVR